MSKQYLYNVEFSVNDYDLWNFPEEVIDPGLLTTCFRFMMNPAICLEVTEEDFFDQVNCDTKVIKNAMFSMGKQQIESDVGGEIVVLKSECPDNEVVIGCYKFKKLHNVFKSLTDQYDEVLEEAVMNENKRCKSDPSAMQPCTEMIKELVQLMNEGEQPSGSLCYTLRVSCLGFAIKTTQQIEKEQLYVDSIESCVEVSREVSGDCRQQISCVEPRDYEEYSAELNGNQLVVRVHKAKKSYRVTRVFDTGIDCDGNELPHDDNMVSICACDQQIDFKFPEKQKCKIKKLQKCACNGSSSLTDYQRRTSCAGNSFKNSCRLPVIRGNLKYPGRFDDKSIKFNVYDKCKPRDATNKYKKQPTTSRSICCQADADNLKRALDGKCEIAKGIKMSENKVDLNKDVFVLRMGRKNTNRCGLKSELELEMRTPKGPQDKKTETREVQCDFSDMDDASKKTGKVIEEGKKKTAGDAKKPQSTKNSIIKKPAVKPTKGFTKKSNPRP